MLNIFGGHEYLRGGPAVMAERLAALTLEHGTSTFILGLGAGAFWDAIVAVGGPRRTPGEAVQALEEGIAVIRGAWGVDGNRTVDVDGEFYRVKGMHAGPVPVHDVQIWLGALKPRMLRVTGRLADGWLPSLGYVTPDNLGEMNAVIDEAADKAGRAPQAVRRMLNIFGGHEYLRGGSAVMAERLAALTLEHGTSTFILGSDDPDELRRFAAEVAPAVRDLVDRERGDSLVEEGRSPVTKPAQPTDSPLPTPTEDDGTRLSPSLPWDEAARPTHTAPAGAAYSRPEHARHLVDIHDHLRSELEQVREVLDQVRRGHLTVGAARPRRRARPSTRRRPGRARPGRR
jgi:hypothetical protein